MPDLYSVVEACGSLDGREVGILFTDEILALGVSVDLYLTKQLHVTWIIHTKREPRLGKGSILFRKTNNNSNNKETLNSGIVLRIGLEFSRSRDSDSPTNLSMAKPVADRNAACILIITISFKGAGC